MAVMKCWTASATATAELEAPGGLKGRRDRDGERGEERRGRGMLCPLSLSPLSSLLSPLSSLPLTEASRAPPSRAARSR